MNQETVTARETRLRKALRDLIEGAASVHIWAMLAWQEIRQRYRRSVLGPFWITISTGALVGGMGPLYGKLFNQELAAYLPHLAIGYITWLYIAGLINEGCVAFISSEGLIKQTRMPLCIHVFRVVWRNFIMLWHNFLVVVITLLFFPPPWHLGLLTVPLAIALITINGVWLGLILGVLCARFRDIPLIVQSVMQMAFFLTPVLWRADTLGRHRWAAEANPLHHYLEIVRAPLLGVSVPWDSWAVVATTTVVGSGVSLMFFVRFRARIAYWV